MEHSIDILENLYKTLNVLKPLKQEDQNRLAKKFRLEFNYNSNHIEGNTLTYGETELLLLFDDTMGNHNMREYEEIKAHDVAYHMIEEWSKDYDRPLTEHIIKNLNEIILVRPYWKEAVTADGQDTRRQIKVGNYKEYPNSVRLQNGEIFEYASPTETPLLMQELIDWYRSEENGLNPITLATMLHYKFVRIHPFDDGNGRISRLLMNYVLLKHNYPPVIIKSSDKNNYLRALHIADIGDYEPLITYISQQVIWSLEISIKAAKGESLEDTDDFIKEIELIKRRGTSKGTPKSPKIVYGSFKMINDKVWGQLKNTLEHFDTLFNETQDVYSVNNINGLPEKKYVSTLDIIRSIEKQGSNEPEKLKIFGHDIYELSINKISWSHTMYALRGAKTSTNLIIYLIVEFNHYDFELQVKIDYTSVYNLKKKYQEIFLNNEIDDLNDILKNKLISFINERVG